MPSLSASQLDGLDVSGKSSNPPTSASLSISPSFPETEPVYVVSPVRVSFRIRLSWSSRMGWDAPLSERTRLYASIEDCSVICEGKNLSLAFQQG